MAKIRYDCEKCPAYCCTYDRIPATKADIKRLAKHFGLSEDKARKKFTKKDDDEDDPLGRVLRHRRDEHFGTACQFLDEETRGCTVYKARPKICRDFPGEARCGYYDFLSFERKHQEDPDWVATTD